MHQNKADREFSAKGKLPNAAPAWGLEPNSLSVGAIHSIVILSTFRPGDNTPITMEPTEQPVGTLFQGLHKASFAYKLLNKMGWEEGKGLVSAAGLWLARNRADGRAAGAAGGAFGGRAVQRRGGCSLPHRVSHTPNPHHT
jgi:hypothetical protein